MAHEIETMAFFGSTPWHGLGTKLEEADQYNTLAAMVKAGLNWTVERVPLVTMDTGDLSDHVMIRRTTDRKCLGTVGPRYEPLQNADAFAWFQPFLDSRQAALHTAGALQGGSRVWILARINRDPLVIAQGDEVEKYILLSHAHDGTLAVRAGFTPIRVVCANTLAIAHGNGASKLIRLKHTANLAENLANLRNVMDAANASFEATAEQYRLLAVRSINQADLRRYVKRVLEIDEDDKNVSTRSQNIIGTIIRNFEAGRGNNLPSIRGTWWSAYNAVTEWLSYDRGSKAEQRLDSLWFGDGANKVCEALQIAVAMAA